MANAAPWVAIAAAVILVVSFVAWVGLYLYRAGVQTGQMLASVPASDAQQKRVRKALLGGFWPTNWGSSAPLETWQTKDRMREIHDLISSGDLEIRVVPAGGHTLGIEFPLARGVVYINQEIVDSGTLGEIAAVCFAEFTHSGQGLGVRSEQGAQEIYCKWLTGLDASGYRYQDHRDERFWSWRHGGNTERWTPPQAR